MVQLLRHVHLSAIPWTTALQASLSFTLSWSLLKVMSIESMMLSNHLIFCPHLLLWPSVFPSIRVFFMSWLFLSGSQSIGISASASVLPMNIQSWFPLGLTDLISLQSKRLSRVNNLCRETYIYLLDIHQFYSFPLFKRNKNISSPKDLYSNVYSRFIYLAPNWK